MGVCLDEAQAFLAGVQSPPLREEANRGKEALWESSGKRLNGVPSEVKGAWPPKCNRLRRTIRTKVPPFLGLGKGGLGPRFLRPQKGWGTRGGIEGEGQY